MEIADPAYGSLLSFLPAQHIFTAFRFDFHRADGYPDYGGGGYMQDASGGSAQTTPKKVGSMFVELREICPRANDSRGSCRLVVSLNCS